LRHRAQFSKKSADQFALIGALALVLVAFFAIVSSADAAHFQRPFKEVFGSAAHPEFEWSESVAVDNRTHDVYVGDYFAHSLYRFNADGTPAPFAALGTNAIDGAAGPNGKPCSEEPASCDQTPGNEVQFNGTYNTQIAIDESNGATKGDIYVSQPNFEAVDIFNEDGKYLGQLTGFGLAKYHASPNGVTVTSTGTVYVAAGHNIYRYEPKPGENPVVNADEVGEPLTAPVESYFNLALGGGPTAGTLFVGANNNGVSRVYEYDLQTGETVHEFALEEFGLGAMAVDPQSGTVLFVSKSHEREVLEFEALPDAEPVRVSRLVAQSRASGFAVNSASEVMLTEGIGEPHARVYGAPGIVPTVTAEPASEVIGTKASLSGTVNPTGVPVTKCEFEYGETSEYGQSVACEGTIGEDSSDPVHAELSGLAPNGVTYHFRLAVTNANGTEESPDQTFTTASTVVTEAAAPIESTSVTFNGTVRPEGQPYSECFFEYGLSSSPIFEKKAPCSPGAGAIGADFFPHPVKAVVTVLEAGTSYRFRLVGKTALGTVKGDERTVTTRGRPQITQVRALDADQGSVTLEGKINPSGFPTTYRFEWGPTTSYGNKVPVEFEPFAGSGESPVTANVKVSGLAAGTTYHYRIVARSEAGTTRSPDQTFETLNSCGLPEGRCFELVSRRDSGPVAIPGEEIASAEMHYQAATTGTGLAYPVEAGYPDATKGAEDLYRALRGPSEWESTQLSAPIAETNEQAGPEAGNGPFEFLSNDLSCGFQQSNQLLTKDPATRMIREYGGSNLYRLNPDGTHTAVTNLAPNNVTAFNGTYNIAGASQSCGKVVFQTALDYPGVAGVADVSEQNLYEWDEGTIRRVGFVPGPGGGEVAVGAAPGTGTGRLGDSQNLVSEDGSRVFFTANRQTSPNEEEIGKVGIFVREFVRESGSVTRDLSESETAVPDTGATYQWATPDGSRVYFLANSGLTENSSPVGGQDLYEYNLETEKLTDVSAWTDPEAPSVGAEAGGFVAASPDGSYVYFVARGQLQPGRGNTYAQNVAQGRYSIFAEHEGKYSYVGKVESEINSVLQRVIVTYQGEWVSQVSPNGQYLLFESDLNTTGYDSGGAPEAYLFNATPGVEETACISCRQDGEPSVAPNGGNVEFGLRYATLPTDESINNPLHPPHYLGMHEGLPEVFFTSPDSLAPGAVEHQNNIYEWSHGQIFRITSAEEGQQDPFPFGGYYAALGGVSNDASNVYFVTPETLTWEDGDARLSAYDARIGGGYPKPATAPQPCNATSEKATTCLGTPQTVTAVPGAATPNVSGSENFEPKKKAPVKKKPSKKKKHGKTQKHGKKHKHKKKGKKKSKRPANGNRRAGK
jgi:hypothetical protein